MEFGNYKWKFGEYMNYGNLLVSRNFIYFFAIAKNKPSYSSLEKYRVNNCKLKDKI